MKILAIHNYYQTRGGEDQLFEDECRLLESKGHQIIWHTRDSEEITDRNIVRVACQSIWNRRSYRDVQKIIREQRPDLLHSVNTFPLFSPSIFYAAQKEKVPVVATIQNYRYFCAQSMCFRAGKSCEDCLGKIPWRAIKNKCYKQSYAGSAVVALMQTLHQKLRSWQNQIDVICLASQFSKRKLVASGIEESKIMIKPNFAPSDPGMRSGNGGYAVFVGRLSGEKGIQTLIDGWKAFSKNNSCKTLKIV
ncbi:MAG: glycosyltransferase, partial [Planctomycetota bacterium]